MIIHLPVDSIAALSSGGCSVIALLSASIFTSNELAAVQHNYAMSENIWILLGGIALVVQAIPPISTHFSATWSVCLFILCLSTICLSHASPLLKPFNGLSMPFGRYTYKVQ